MRSKSKYRHDVFSDNRCSRGRKKITVPVAVVRWSSMTKIDGTYRTTNHTLYYYVILGTQYILLVRAPGPSVVSISLHASVRVVTYDNNCRAHRTRPVPYLTRTNTPTTVSRDSPPTSAYFYLYTTTALYWQQ